MLLSNRAAVITGGSRGIGKAIALTFADHGSAIVIGDILEKEGRETVEEIAKKGREALFLRCDASDSGQVQNMIGQAIQKFGKVDILVNNAGIGPLPKSITGITDEEWNRTLAINLTGVFFCCRAITPYMKERKYGKIINISSMAAVVPPIANIHYSSAKAGVLGLTLDLALELAPFNICVNAILPGAIPTDIWDKLIPPEVPSKEVFFAEVGKMISPMGRVGTAEEVAKAALFLASDLSSYVTGDRIFVAGEAPLRALPVA
jgi:NAD(P)-dependent dehydrogenase (short-subunit alcohol dehydrogenase family)